MIYCIIKGLAILSDCLGAICLVVQTLTKLNATNCSFSFKKNKVAPVKLADLYVHKHMSAQELLCILGCHRRVVFHTKPEPKQSQTLAGDREENRIMNA